MEKIEDHNKVKSWIILIVLAIIWGSSFILMKRGMDAYTPYQVAAMRVLIAASVLFPFIFNKIKNIEIKYWKYLMIVGVFGNTIPAFLFTIAETEISSALAGILNALTPIFTLAIAFALFKTRIRWVNTLGVIIGFVGAVGIIFINAEGTMDFTNVYAILPVVATIFYAVSINTIRNFLHPLPSVVISGAALLPVGIGCGIYLFTTDVIARTAGTGGAESLIYVAILAIFGTAISIVFFNDLIKMSGPIFASSVTYLIPIVAIMWGIFDNEILSWLHFVGLAVILFGVYLVNKKRKAEIVSNN
ncbi:MAG: DMT family transporter [Bacteroidia bacterium]